MFKERPNILRSLMDNCSKYDDARWLLSTPERASIRDYTQYLESFILALVVIFIIESLLICAYVLRWLFSF